MKNLTLITGAVRSGKSRFAEKLTAEFAGPVVYIATMPRLEGDSEQESRIQRHRSRRPPSWQTVEAPYDLPAAVSAVPNSTAACLIDCVSVFISNLIIGPKQEGINGDPYQRETAVFAGIDELLQSLQKQTQTHFILVTNEVGWGIVPETALGRAFRDFVGLANQKIAAEAEEVWLTCAGIPIRVKPQTGALQ